MKEIDLDQPLMDIRILAAPGVISLRSILGIVGIRIPVLPRLPPIFGPLARILDINLILDISLTAVYVFQSVTRTLNTGKLKLY
jgi:hypothetical protein